MITYEQAGRLVHGQNLYSLTQSYPHRSKGASKAPVRVRVSGAVKVWGASRPGEFKVPVKYGLRQSFYITPQNAAEWTLDEQEAIDALNRA